MIERFPRMFIATVWSFFYDYDAHWSRRKAMRKKSFICVISKPFYPDTQTYHDESKLEPNRSNNLSSWCNLSWRFIETSTSRSFLWACFIQTVPSYGRQTRYAWKDFEPLTRVNSSSSTLSWILRSVSQLKVLPRLEVSLLNFSLHENLLLEKFCSWNFYLKNSLHGEPERF